MRITFICATCAQQVPARNVCVGPNGEQNCRACNGEGENDMDVPIGCNDCGQRGWVPSIWWNSRRDPPRCACGGAVAEVH